MVAVSLMTYSVGGGSGADTFTSAGYEDAGAAVAAASNGFIVFANPVDAGETTSLGKSRAVSVAAIRQIVSV